ncbi:MAG: hypothetical protein QOH36_2388 [Actinomycetota bacterium]|nr:hypothetical protein [Actinomycetota bacterium]
MAVGTAGGDRSASTYFARAIVDSRSTIHLSYRLVIRLVQWTAVSGAASPGTGIWRASLPAFVVLDLVTWQVLRRSDRFGLSWRVALDCADIAFWSLSPLPTSQNYDNAVLISIPLSIEAGFRMGIGAMVVPLTVAAVVAPIRILDGRSAHPFTALWLVLGLGVGMAVFSYCRRLDEHAEAERGRRRTADARWAYLVGQNAVAMGADSVVDVIEGLVPVLGRPGEGSALWRLADGWKTRLAADTATQAAYLQVVLLGWESAYNRHPDLAARVQFHLGEGIGTTILTGPQVAWLHAALDRSRLRGTIRVTLTGDAGDRPPGAGLDLEVGGRPIRVPADRAAAVRPVDTGPVAYALIGAQLLAVVLPGRGMVPVAGVGSGIAVCGIAAWWSHRQLLRRGPLARPAILRGAVVAALAVTLLTAPLVTESVNADGDTSYIALGVMLLAFIGGMYREGLERRLVVLVGLAAMLVAGLVFALTPGPTNFRSFLCAIAYSVAIYPPCRHISRALARATERHLEATVAEDEEARAAAFLRGQESVVDLVRLARDDARRQLAAVAPRLEPALNELVSARLEEVDRRLLSLAPAAG